jgi:membrane protein implicated in regulation of membrane protease activity
MNYLSLIWLLSAFIFLIFELGHPSLFLYLSFFCGSLLAFCASFLSYSLLHQLMFMVVGTAVSLIILGCFLRRTKQLNLNNEPKTNMYALQGKRGYVLKEITSISMGEVKIGAERWSARSLHQDVISVGALVEVVQVSGCHCVVKVIK